MASLLQELAYVREQQRRANERAAHADKDKAAAVMAEQQQRTDSRRNAAAAAALAAAAHAVQAERQQVSDAERRFSLLATLGPPPLPNTGLPAVPPASSDPKITGADAATKLSAAAAALQRSSLEQDLEAGRPPLVTYKKRQPECPAAELFNCGTSHVPGWLLHPPADAEAAVPNLPARSGMGARLRPAALSAHSCVPPPYDEPTVPPPPSIFAQMQQAEVLRTMLPGRVINKLVFDSLEPPKASNLGGVGDDADGSDGGDPGDCTGVEAGGCTGGDADGDACAGLAFSGADAPEAAKPAALSAHATADAPANAADAPCGAAEAAPGAGEGEERSSGGRGGSCGIRRGGGSGSGAQCTFDYAKDLPAWYQPSGDDDTTLVFESRFESGNLRRALQVYPNEYDLILSPDVNTRGHTQWYYFAVSNTRKGQSYKFNIINLMKDNSLYNDGLLPLVHSARKLAGEGVGWHRSGEKVAYYGNNVPRGKAGRRHYFTLTFTVTSAYDRDVVHLAHCYPYTYTDLQRYLYAKLEQPLPRAVATRSTLCSTLAGNTVDVIRITSPGSVEALKKRRGVIISARVHPGETNASWMMKGVLDFLLGPSLDAKLLRDSFVFKLVPMLNPDGVIVGNYRCSLAGQDLNRVWNAPSRTLHPTIFAMKNMVKEFMTEREVVLFCDLHGHSRKKGIFCYGCEKLPRDFTPMYPGFPVPGSHGVLPTAPVRMQEKLIPLLLQANAPDLFMYNGCNFKVQKSKGGTGRVVSFRELGLANGFTMEASFCGSGSTGRWAGLHFSTMHLEKMGAALCTTVLDYCDPQAYGHTDLLAQLDYMHPEGGATRKLVMAADGTYIDADDFDEDDEPPTDSEDSDSDEESKRARADARRRRVERKAAMALQLQAGPAASMAPIAGNPSAAAGMGGGGAVPLSAQQQRHAASVANAAAQQAYQAALAAAIAAAAGAAAPVQLQEVLSRVAAAGATTDAPTDDRTSPTLNASRDDGAANVSGIAAGGNGSHSAASSPSLHHSAPGARAGTPAAAAASITPSQLAAAQAAAAQAAQQAYHAAFTAVAGSPPPAVHPPQGAPGSAPGPPQGEGPHHQDPQHQHSRSQGHPGWVPQPPPPWAHPSLPSEMVLQLPGMLNFAQQGWPCAATPHCMGAELPHGGGNAAESGVFPTGGGSGVAASSAESTPKKRKGRKKLDRALLQAEELKATQGLAACLPVVGAQFELPHSNSLTADASADAASPTATLAAAAAAAAAAGHGGTASPERVSPAKVAHQLPARAAASAVERAAMVSAAQAAADRVAGLEYARSIGIYRGEELSWANAGMSVLPSPPSAPNLSSLVSAASAAGSFTVATSAASASSAGAGLSAPQPRWPSPRAPYSATSRTNSMLQRQQQSGTSPGRFGE
uniref:Peptidase M14 domain-containing protein n=1 Tax=Chlamydomonas euryale TaxID=1486919 RepID=A0A6U2EXJ2_9CHLO|mmetsp:Transcript_25518/g.75416  ORF Transcript_25518/g.75416 Transcript_25518/m.75416 type:complete len:1395 (+) Transcript_25518:337-4521(+)